MKTTGAGNDFDFDVAPCHSEKLQNEEVERLIEFFRLLNRWDRTAQCRLEQLERLVVSPDDFSLLGTITTPATANVACDSSLMASLRSTNG